MKRRDSFPFDVDDWRKSRTVQRMSMSERGVYLEMLCEQWDTGPLVDNSEAVALRIAVTDAQVSEVIAAWPVVRRCFATLPDGRIQNLRLERCRDEHARKPVDVDASPVVLTFPTSGNPATWELHQAQLVTWIGLYPAVNVEAECRKALAWLQAKGSPKTAKGMPRFLVNWFSRATDRRGISQPVAIDRREPMFTEWSCEHDPHCLNRGACLRLAQLLAAKRQGVA